MAYPGGGNDQRFIVIVFRAVINLCHDTIFVRSSMHVVLDGRDQTIQLQMHHAIAMWHCLSVLTGSTHLDGVRCPPGVVCVKNACKPVQHVWSTWGRCYSVGS